MRKTNNLPNLEEADGDGANWPIGSGDGVEVNYPVSIRVLKPKGVPAGIRAIKVDTASDFARVLDGDVESCFTTTWRVLASTGAYND